MLPLAPPQMLLSGGYCARPRTSHLCHLPSAASFLSPQLPRTPPRTLLLGGCCARRLTTHIFLRPPSPASFPCPQVPRALAHTLLLGGFRTKPRFLHLIHRPWPAPLPWPQVPRAPPHTLLLGGCSFMPFRQHEQGNVTKLSGDVLQLREQGQEQRAQFKAQVGMEQWG